MASEVKKGQLSSHSPASLPFLLPSGTCPGKADGQTALSGVRTPKSGKLPVVYPYS